MSSERFRNHQPAFWGVALFLILAGAAVVALGLVEWLFTLLGAVRFSLPLFKLVGGLIVTALGYILLELELIRISGKK